MADLSFRETGLKIYAGVIQSVEPGSLADALGLQPGDEVLAVNGHPVADVIDVQFYAAEDEVEITYQRAGRQSAVRSRRLSGQPLGLEFVHPTFDIDIRRCNNLCPFCFVLQSAPRMRRTLYIKDDDYRYSFLYGHFVTLTNLSAHDWQRIEAQHLSPLYVSVHSTDLENRRACLANQNAPDILEQLRWLAERGIQTHTQIVVTPGLNDGPWLEKSVHDLAELYPAVRSVSVVPVGLTKHHKYGYRPPTVTEARAVLKSVQRWQAEFRPRLGVRFVYPTDEWFLLTAASAFAMRRTPTGVRIPSKRYYDGLALQENGLGMVRDFLDEWRRSRREIRDRRLKSQISNLKSRHAKLITATLFAPLLAKVAAEFDALAGTRLDVIPVRNERLGPTITVAGLLMGQDIIAQLTQQAQQTARQPGEFIVLPRVMFDHPAGVSLDDVHPLQIAQALDRPVYLAEAMGDVLDAFTGRNTLAFDPANPARTPQPMKPGGWAVEKYL